jgi:hypothetical protein
MSPCPGFEPTFFALEGKPTELLPERGWGSQLLHRVCCKYEAGYLSVHLFSTVFLETDCHRKVKLLFSRSKVSQIRSSSTALELLCPGHNELFAGMNC